jgi:hypothetical protein
MGAESLTVDGLWILSPPFRRLDADAARTEIGKAVLEVAGIKSWSTLVKGAVLVDVSIEEEWATLAPTRNLGARGLRGPGHRDRAAHSIDDADALGEQVLQALDLATQYGRCSRDVAVLWRCHHGVMDLPQPQVASQPRATWHRRRLIGVAFAFAGAALLLISSFLPLFIGQLTRRGVVQFKMTVTGWGFGVEAGPNPASPVTRTGAVAINAYPLVFAGVLLFIGTVVALLAARNAATDRGRRAAVVTLAIAAAFTSGTALTVGVQAVSWTDSFQPTGGAAGNSDFAVDANLGVGFWLLLMATLLAIGAALHAALPSRQAEPDLDTPRYGIPVQPAPAPPPPAPLVSDE